MTMHSSPPSTDTLAGMHADWHDVPLADADLALCAPWLPSTEADALFAVLQRSIHWERHRIRLFGRMLEVPRLSSWIGDPGTAYRYSGTRFEPNPWLPELDAVRRRVEHACNGRFNSVLANLYRDGRDSMGWHSDDEPELGPHPVIASLSLGATRRFRLRRRLPRGERPGPGDTLELPLTHGSLLRMGGNTQREYRHELPKSRAAMQPRINLTFRWVTPPTPPE